jgi:hypothetical protein
MGHPDAPPHASPETPPGETGRDRAHPLLIVVGTLAAVVAITFVVFAVGGGPTKDSGRNATFAQPVSSGECGVPTPADATYTADVTSSPDPPPPTGASFTFMIRHGGKGVTGAKVCLNADMPEMQHPGISYLLTESSGGRYGARIQFSMGGTWRGSLTVAEPGMPIVSVPVTIQVAEVAD